MPSDAYDQAAKSIFPQRSRRSGKSHSFAKQSALAAAYGNPMLRLTSSRLFYLVRSGKALQLAEQYRERTIAMKNALVDAVKHLKPEGIDICKDLMLIRSLSFKNGEVPAGFSKSERTGASRPLRIAANMELRKYFTPDGGYQIVTHADLRPFFDWLKCPCSYAYKKGSTEEGWSALGGCDPVGLAWFGEHSPLLLWTPNIAKAREDAIAKGQTITDNVLDWQPPRGLHPILKQEWDLMVARDRLSRGLDPNTNEE